MELADRRIGEIVVITLTSSDAADLRQAMTRIFESRATRVILDLEELPYLDSLGLGELVECQLLAGCSARKLR